MGLFDSVGDLQVQSASDWSGFESGGLGFDWEIPSSSSLLSEPSSLFPSASYEPDGLQLLNGRSNTSFWNFDQSLIPSGLSDVLGSLGSAAVKSAVQGSADLINKQAKDQTALGGFFRNFQSTQTGAQLNAGAIGTRIQNFMANPLVWFGAVGLVAVFFLMRK
jgi:hypothetical protein